LKRGVGDKELPARGAVDGGAWRATRGRG